MMCVLIVVTHSLLTPIFHWWLARVGFMQRRR